MRLTLKTMITTGVNLTLNRASKFRTNLLTCHFIGPIEAATNTEMTLLTWILAHGNQKYPESEQLSLALAKLYGANLQVYHQNFGRWRDLIVEISFVDPLSDRAIGRECLDLIKDIIFEPLLGAARFDHEVYQAEYQALQTELLDLETDHDFQTFASTKAAFFDAPSLQTPRVGNLQELQHLSETHLGQLYQQLINDWRVEIVGYGQSLPADEQMKDWAFPARQPVLPQPQILNQPLAKPKVIEREIVGEQTHLCLAYTLPDLSTQVARDTLRLTAAILGGDEQSLLFRQVREQAGLAYDISATYDSFLGWLYVEAGVDRQQVDEAQAAISAVFAQARQSIDSQLLELEKENEINEQLQSQDQPRTRALQLFADAVFPERHRNQAEFAAAIHHISLTQVQEMLAACQLKVVTRLLNRSPK